MKWNCYAESLNKTNSMKLKQVCEEVNKIIWNKTKHLYLKQKCDQVKQICDEMK